MPLEPELDLVGILPRQRHCHFVGFVRPLRQELDLVGILPRQRHCHFVGFVRPLRQVALRPELCRA